MGTGSCNMTIVERLARFAARAANPGFGVADDCERPVDGPGLKQGPDGQVCGGRIASRIGHQARPPLTPALSPHAGRGRDPWRIRDAPPARRKHACTERGGRVRGGKRAKRVDPTTPSNWNFHCYGTWSLPGRDEYG